MIIGGGAVGVSVAYHLARRLKPRSRNEVVLLEKSELTSGSTWHAAGLVTAFHPAVNLKRLHWYSLNFFNHVERETGSPVGFHKPGSLRLATNGERLKEFEYQLSRQGWNDSPMKLWSKEEIRDNAPLIDVDGANVRLS